jgi:hypothetical protein
VNLRNEALLMLDGQGALLHIARGVSHLMRTAGISGVVIGGVAREFVKQGVPVQLMPLEQVGEPPSASADIEGVTTVTLTGLINMQLCSGSTSPLRAQDKESITEPSRPDLPQSRRAVIL